MVILLTVYCECLRMLLLLYKKYTLEKFTQTKTQWQAACASIVCFLCKLSFTLQFISIHTAALSTLLW